MQGTSLGVLADPLGGPHRQLADPHRGGELANGGGVQAVQAHPGPAAVVDEPVQAPEQLARRTLPGADQCQHPVRMETPQGEEQRLE